MKMQLDKSRQGQAMVEYIIIVVVVAVAALVVFGLFGDTIIKKMSGAVSSLDEDLGSDAQTEADKSSADQLRNLEADGTGN